MLLEPPCPHWNPRSEGRELRVTDRTPVPEMQRLHIVGVQEAFVAYMKDVCLWKGIRAAEDRDHFTSKLLSSHRAEGPRGHARVQ